jgi:hypothetical protein
MNTQDNTMNTQNNTTSDKFPALSAATLESGSKVDSMFDNDVEMPLHQAETMMSDRQKKIVDELIALGGTVKRVFVAIGGGLNEHGSICVMVERDWISRSVSVRVNRTGFRYGVIHGSIIEGGAETEFFRTYSSLKRNLHRAGLYERD